MRAAEEWRGGRARGSGEERRARNYKERIPGIAFASHVLFVSWQSTPRLSATMARHANLDAKRLHLAWTWPIAMTHSIRGYLCLELCKAVPRRARLSGCSQQGCLWRDEGLCRGGEGSAASRFTPSGLLAGQRLQHPSQSVAGDSGRAWASRSLRLTGQEPGRAGGAAGTWWPA